MRRFLGLQVRWPVSLGVLSQQGRIQCLEKIGNSREAIIPHVADPYFVYADALAVIQNQYIFLAHDVYINSRDGIFFLGGSTGGGMLPIEKQSAISPFAISDTIFPRLQRDQAYGSWICLSSRTLAHWMFDDLPRFVKLVKFLTQENKDFQILIHPQAPNYVKDIISAFSKKFSISYLESNTLRVERAYFLTIGTQELLPLKSDIELIRSFMADLFPQVTFSCSAKLIYVSRKFSNRPLSIEEEIETQLQNLGFQIVYAERLTWIERIQAFTYAEVVVGPLGAGLSSLIFNDGRARVVELYEETMRSNHFYAQVCQVLGLDYSRHEVTSADAVVNFVREVII